MIHEQKSNMLPVQVIEVAINPELTALSFLVLARMMFSAIAN